MTYDPSRRGLRLLGWTILLLFFPIAVMAILHPPNEYRATLGIDALDCQGPAETYLFAVPTLIVYGSALVLNARQRRRRARLIVAILCFAICAGTLANVARALAEAREQSAECARP